MCNNAVCYRVRRSWTLFVSTVMWSPRKYTVVYKGLALLWRNTRCVRVCVSMCVCVGACVWSETLC